MSEAEFRQTLDPVAIVRERATSGGPQAAEMTRCSTPPTGSVAEEAAWVAGERGRIDRALASLDADFGKLLAQAPR